MELSNNQISDTTSAQDEYFMQMAYDLAQQASEHGEIPVGAIIVSQGQIIGQGYNCPISSHDPTAHAEIIALREACQYVQNYRLPQDSVLYVTLEPCTMCVGALIHARIQRVVFATQEPKAGSLISARRLLESGYYNHIFQYEYGCLQEKCSQQLSQFFRQRREEKRQKRAIK